MEWCDSAMRYEREPSLTTALAVHGQDGLDGLDGNLQSNRIGDILDHPVELVVTVLAAALVQWKSNASYQSNGASRRQSKQAAVVRKMEVSDCVHIQPYCRCHGTCRFD